MNIQYTVRQEITMARYHATNPLVTDIDPTILAAQRQVNALLAQMPHPDVRTPDGLAALRAGTANNPGSTELTPTDRIITGPDGDIRIRVFTPEGPHHAVMLRIHGGGWAAGAPEDDDVLNDRIARACGVVIVSPQYRLVPDVTVADQIADCLAVADWLGTYASTEFGADRLLIGGTSAGAHLAAATLVGLRDAGHQAFDLFVGAHLDCGAYDLGATPSVVTSTDQTLILTHDWLYGLLEIGLPGHTAEQRRTPSLSPALADLTGMPPALFTVGNLDPLRDDALLLSGRWQLAGSTADLDVWPEGAHTFTNMATPLGEAALERTIAWITRTLDRHDDPATVVTRFIHDVVNGGDIDAVDDLWADDLTWHGGSLGDIHGLDAFKTHLRANTSGAFDDMHLRIDEIVTDQDKVAVRFVNSGTQTGPFLGTPAAGRHAQWQGINLYTVANGKITEVWIAEDILGMLQQLGAVQLPAT
jgi:acetyl esterase